MDHTTISSAASAAAIYRRKCAQALEHLQGIVDGMMSDGRLDPKEVHFLNSWLTSHPEATADWPGSLLHRKVRQILADGLISGAEQRYLHEALSHLASTVFDDADQPTPQVTPLPIDDSAAVDIRGAQVCLAGAFLFGTRAACERLVLSAGATLAERVSTKSRYLVIGMRGAPSWPSAPYGEDIQEAIALRSLGHPIAIVSERRLLESLC
jgi:hypothetical protein